MFIEVLMNYQTGKRRLFRTEDIVSITYNGDKSINFLFTKASQIKTKSFGITYDCKEQAENVYNDLLKQLRTKI
jgi:hypothetical protein